MGQRIYEVPEGNWPKLCEKLEKLTNRAAKIGVKLPIVNRIDDGTYFKEFGKQKVLVYQLEIISEPVAISGWQFVATIELGDPEIGLVINKVPGLMDNEDLPKNFRVTTNFCEHCQKNIRRNSVYVLRHIESGEFKQVGRNCLGLFLGGIDPENVVSNMEYLFRLDSLLIGSGDYCGGGKREWDSLESILFTTMAVIKRKGWLSRSKAQEMYPPGTSTATYVNQMRYVEYKDMDMGGKELYNSIAQMDQNEKDSISTTVADVIDWVRAIDSESANDYLHNLKVACHLDMVRIKHIGIIASAIITYQKAMDLLKPKADKPNLTHIGVEGERDTFILRVVDVKYWNNSFGVTTAVLMQDNAGNKAIWKASSDPQMKKDQVYSLKGTVKKHTMFGQYPQTELTRCNSIKLLSV